MRMIFSIWIFILGLNRSFIFQTDNEIMATAFRISDLDDNDLKEISNFKDIVKSYLKMERIAPRF